MPKHIVDFIDCLRVGLLEDKQEFSLGDFDSLISFHIFIPKSPLILLSFCSFLLLFPLDFMLWYVFCVQVVLQDHKDISSNIWSKIGPLWTLQESKEAIILSCPEFCETRSSLAQTRPSMVKLGRVSFATQSSNY